MLKAIKVERVTSIKISYELGGGKFSTPKFYHTAHSAAHAFGERMNAKINDQRYYSDPNRQNYVPCNVFLTAYRRSLKIFKQMLP